MSEFDAGKITASLVLDRSDFQKGIDQARASAKKLSGEKFTVTLDADTSPANRKVDELRAKVAKLSGGSIAIDADTAKASAAISGLQAKVDRLSGGSIRVDADTSAAANKLNALGAQLARLTQQRHTVRVDADTARAQNNLNALGGQLQRIASQRASVQVDADTAQARAQLAAMQAQLNRLDGKSANANVGVSGGGQATTILAAIVAGLGAVGAAAPAAAAALAAVPSALGVAAQGIGTIMSGFSGIGDAMKAVETQEKSSASTASSAAKQRSSAARQIENAQSSLQQAEESAARASITASRQISDAQGSLAQARQAQARTAAQGAAQVAAAEQSLAQAVTQAARQRITSDEQVAQARRSVSDAIAAANQRVSSAEASLASAQRSRQYAQEALTRATEDATRANRDLQLSVAGAGLAEERAALSLAQARKRLASNTSTDPLEIADLNLSVREAEQNLKEVGVRYGDLTDEQAKWARTGIQGSDQVVAATRALEDAQRGVADAQGNVTDAQVSGARAVADAQDGLSRAVRQASWQQADSALSVANAQRNVQEATAAAAQANADAADAVTKAQQGVADAVQQAGWSQQDAARGVANAQRALADAYASAADSADGGAASSNKAAEALAKLSPAGRDFVNFLQNEWKPAWENSSKDVAERMLPGIESGMRSLLSVQPLLSKGLADTGETIGNLAAKGGALAASAPFRADFASIMESNNRAIGDLGDAGISLFGAFTDLYTVAGPMVERFTRLADYSAQAFESWIIGQRATGDLERNLQSAGDTLMWLGGLLIDVAGDVLEVASNFAPLGAVLLEAIRWTTDFAAGLTSLLGPGLTSVVAGAGLAAIAISKLGTAMAGLALAQGAGGIRGFATVMGTLLNPAALNATTAMSGLRDSFAKAGYAAGSSVAGMTGMAGAAEKGYTAGSKLGGALTKMGSALPLVGVAVIGVSEAWDALTLSSSEAADALLQGGVAAQQAMEKLAWQDQLKKAFPIFQGWVDGVNEGTEAAKRQYDQMTLLQQRQTDATQAQNNYEKAVREFGQSSPQAIAAQQNLAAATDRVEIAQSNARRATMNATQALQDQQDQILGSLDSRLRLESATRNVERAQKDYADAVSGSGRDSLEARDAYGQLQDAQVRQAEAARQASLDESKRKGIVDGSAEANRAYAASIGDMVTKTKGELSPALVTMVQTLDGAGLAAAGAKVQIDNAGNAVAVFPNGKTVTLDANTSLAMQGLDGVAAKLQQVPDHKTVTVATLSADAETKLTNIGFTVTHLPNGQVQITATDVQARGTLDAFQQFAAWQVANPQMAADPAKAYDAMRNFLIAAGQKTGVPMLDANPQRANDQVKAALGRYNTSWATIPVGANTWNATAAASKARDDIDSTHGQIHIGANYDQAQQDTGGFLGWLKRVFTTGPMPIAAGGGLIGSSSLPERAAGGLLRGPGTGTSDSILGLSSGGVPTARVSNGEYVVRAAAVRAMGVPALNAINAVGHASGGLVGLAAGGPAPLASSMAAGTPAAPQTVAAPVASPAGDPTAATAAASATDTLTASMGTATSAAATLTPMLATLAATQAGVLAPSTDLVTVGQQNLVAAGVTPLVAALAGTLFPTLGVYQQQVGVAAPLANTNLQTAQTGTQVSTNLTAANTALNSTLMAGAITAMALTGQAQHAGLRAGQALTMANTAATATNTALNSQNMAISTTNMSLIGQQQHGNLRISQGLTQAQTTTTAQNTAANNANMIATTGNMSATNQSHLANLRGAQGVTNQSTVAFADSWRAQLGRTMPDSANPIRWVINFPIRSITDAWNNLDAQFALGKRVNPYIPGFAAGGLLRGPGTGTSDSILGVGADGMPTARVSNGEFVVRQAVARRVTPFLSALNSGNGEALQAAGGTMASKPKTFRGKSGIGLAAGGPVEQRIQQAFAWLSGPARGARYVYGGGTNPAAGMDCCIVGGVRVYGTFGSRPIRDIREGDEVYSYVDGKLATHRVTAAWQSKTQPVFKVRTRNRAVTASANHPFLRLAQTGQPVQHVEDAEWSGVPEGRARWGSRKAATCSVSTCRKSVTAAKGMCHQHYQRWSAHGDPRVWFTTSTHYDVEFVRLDELRRGDLLVQPRTMMPAAVDAPALADGTLVDADLAWLIGAFVGDGTVSDRRIALCLFGEKRDRAAQILHDKWGGTQTYTDRHGIQQAHKQMAHALAALGLLRRGADKRLPEAVWTWPAELQAAVLEGYCDADGHRPTNTAKYGTRTYHSAARELIEDVRSLHIILGDPVSNVTVTKRDKPIYIKGKLVQKALDQHAFTVWNKGGKSGEAVLRRNAAIATWLDSGEFTLGTVLEISDEGVQDTYDLTVEGAHNFVADGVVVHNSSMQSAVTHILSGRNPNSGRIGTTASMPWGGFARGQGSRYVIGNKPADHMASTLAGRNVEQHGPTGTPFTFPSRWGADAPYFTARYFLPEVGGSFVSGGVGAGGGIDVGPIVDAAFAKTYQQVADVPRFFGPSAQVGRDQGVAKVSADRIKAKAMEAVSAATASAGVMDTSGISGPVVEQVRQVAARYGWGQGPEWDAIVKIVQKESSWNPNAASPVSSARGLFQKMTSIHGPVEPTPAGQAAWGLNYIKGRYQTPTRAWTYHQAHNFYDEGGWLPQGASVAVNHTGKRENKAVFTEDQWKTMQGQAEAQRRGTTSSGDSIDYDRLAKAIASASGPRASITVQPRADQSEERLGRVLVKELEWAGRMQ